MEWDDGPGLGAHVRDHEARAVERNVKGSGIKSRREDRDERQRPDAQQDPAHGLELWFECCYIVKIKPNSDANFMPIFNEHDANNIWC